MSKADAAIQALQNEALQGRYCEQHTPAVDKPAPNERFYRPSAVQTRIEFLERHRVAIKAHMLTRIEDDDHHGTSDDANDLREVDAELRGLRFVARQP